MGSEMCIRDRSRSDSSGLVTFRFMNGSGQSCIDYAIVSRDLMMCDENSCIDFKIIPIHICPNRRSRKRYDHCPIVSAIRWSAFTDVKQIPPDDKGPKIRWRHEHRRLYTDIVQTDGEVLRCFGHIKDGAISVKDACNSLIGGIMRAAEVFGSWWYFRTCSAL